MMTEDQRRDELAKRIAKLGFKSVKAVGLDIINLEVDETYILRIESEIKDFTKKDGKIMKYVEVTNLETGETGNIWTGGQLVYQLTRMKDGFIGGVFAITYKGLVDVEGEEMHQYTLKAVN